jgi:hypothetical protein
MGGIPDLVPRAIPLPGFGNKIKSPVLLGKV